MTNTKLMNEILEEAKKRTPKRGPSNLKALFLVHKNDISEALKQGWSLKNIWATLHSDKRFPGSYCAFTRYCTKLLTNAETPPPKETPAPENPQNTPQAQASQKNQENQDTPRKGPYDSGDHNLPTFTRNLDEKISFL